MTTYPPEHQAIESEIRAKAHGCLAEPTPVELSIPDPPSTVAAQLIEENAAQTEESTGGTA